MLPNRITCALPVLMTLLCIPTVSWAQTAAISGIPGDGIPDLYYFPLDGLEVSTTSGIITRPAGTLTLDTDGTDFLSLSVGGPDVSQPPQCDLCEGMFLPNFNAPPPLFSSTYSVTATESATTWWQSAPPNIPGFVGVIAEWPDDGCNFGINCPRFGLADYGPNPMFDEVFRNEAGTLWEVEYLSFAEGTFYTDITFVPEPTDFFLFIVGGIATLQSRRWMQIHS